MKGIVISPDGSAEVKDFAEPLHKSVGTEVGGYIEIARTILPSPYVMIVNEEGLLRGLPSNLVASVLHGGREGSIVGSAVIMAEGYVDGEPDIVGLTDHQIVFLLRSFEVARIQVDAELERRLIYGDDTPSKRRSAWMAATVPCLGAKGAVAQEVQPPSFLEAIAAEIAERRATDASRD